MKNNNVFWVLVAVAAILRLLFVANNEIVAIPYDSSQYVKHAAVSVFHIGPAPGYPLWLAATRPTAIPQRLLIELFFLTSALTLSVVIQKQFGRVAGLFVWGTLLATPSTLFMFDSALSDGMYACLSLLTLTFSCNLIFSKNQRTTLLNAAVLGAVLGGMAVTRNEDPVLVAWVLVVLVAVALTRKMGKKPPFDYQGSRLLAGVCIAIFLPAFLIVQSINFVHYSVSGVYARSIAGLPGHMKLLKNLARIDTGAPSIRYVPISAEARRLAYVASPKLKKLQPWVEDRSGAYQVASRASGIPDGEIGAGWIWHVFNHATLELLKTGDARVWESEYEGINDELDAAFREGRLGQRFVWHSFLTSPLGEIASRAPTAMLSVLKKSFNAHEYTEDLGFESSVFDSVAMRRNALVAGGSAYSLQGWAFVNAPRREIRSVRVEAVDGVGAGSVVRMDRTDVAKAYAPEKGWAPEVVGFRVDAKGASNTPMIISYLLDDGTRVDNRTTLTATGVTSLKGIKSADVIQGVDVAVLHPLVRNGWRHSAQLYLVNLANQSVTPWLILAVVVGAGLWAAFLSRSRSNFSKMLPFLSILILALIFLRVSFYGLLESEAWVVEVRYMLSTNLMLMVVFGLWLSFVFSSLRAIFCRGIRWP